MLMNHAAMKEPESYPYFKLWRRYKTTGADFLAYSGNSPVPGFIVTPALLKEFPSLKGYAVLLVWGQESFRGFSSVGAMKAAGYLPRMEA